MTTLDIFRAGRHVAASGEVLEFSADDLAKTAAAYDPAIHDAPLVVGHPQSDDPAYGWVSGLSVEDGVLRASTQDVEPAFAELVNARRFKHISASFYRPDSAVNPAPGTWYLRHVGFLGAAPPAVKGLRSPSFSASDGDAVVTVAFTEQEDRQNMPTPEELAARAAELDAREAALAEQTENNRKRAAALAEADNANFIETLVTEGKLPSGLAPRARELMGMMDGDSPVAFGEGDGKASLTPRAAFRDLLRSMPTLVEFGERGRVPGADEAQVSFNAPAGYQVDKAGLALHERALAYQAKHAGTDYLAAVAAVKR